MKNNSWIWILVFLMVFANIDKILYAVVAIAGIISLAIFLSSRNKDESKSTRHHSIHVNGVDASKMAKINIYLRKYFKNNLKYNIDSTLNLRLHSDKFTTINSLDLYDGDSKYMSFMDYGKQFPDEYDKALEKIYKDSEGKYDEVIDVEATPVETSQSQVQLFIDQINELNNDIPDEDISNGLYETTALLTQIKELEEKFPNSKTKLRKLYEHYLPILIQILKQYRQLQNAKSDANYESTYNRLKKTISLINDAMRKIISSLTDQDMMNLSADISTLEALLKKDGLSDESTLSMGDDHE